MTKKTTNKGSDAVTIAIIGTTVAGLAAAAYFFLGPKGKKNQKHAKAWAIKMKGDVVEKLETAREVSEPIYQGIIDSVVAEYVKGEKASREEIEELAKDLKKHWKTLAGGIKTVKRDVASTAKKVSKKAKR
ncbi:hypothetical protein AUJ77_01520 [Candidatus Nomurabacteria bacterium CG1_02_43_90]|uniref:Uncharacterized protein n=1 Tax=Candidatus Nomurabacteria bacterium CG1_02_43_90 TaxID=1805281 RepID=A0A1J4V4H0_9BACT|nr:MAG: hypothetical protein AUJ77_01520 [Candidatus Nomurabacteria bacterium CG1_02_43_90]